MHKPGSCQDQRTIRQAQSEVTIYRDAVESCKLPGRLSSSSEEEIDSSSELIDLNQVIKSVAGAKNLTTHQSNGPQPGGSSDATPNQLDIVQTQATKKSTPEERAEKIIKEAEIAEGQIFSTNGKNFHDYDIDHAREMIHSVLVDEEYSAVGGHLDDTVIGKIKRGEYVDFARLLPRDRIAIEEDKRLQPIFKNGQVYWQTPMETGSITTYGKWEVAFKVFAKIYTKYHPHRVSELIQYSHDIHATSLTYYWDNIYLMIRNLGCIWLNI